MRSHRIATTLRGAAVVACVGALTGCGTGSGGARDAAEARSSLGRVLEATQDAVGVGWQVRDDPNSRGCVIRLWEDGVQYPALRLGPAADDPDAVVEAVDTLWTGLGYDTRRAEIGAVTELRGSRGRGELIILRASDSATTLQGESECSPAG